MYFEVDYVTMPMLIFRSWATCVQIGEKEFNLMEHNAYLLTQVSNISPPMDS